jgi:CDP-diacylglycerol--serine O-phosphatidyltransferase
MLALLPAYLSFETGPVPADYPFLTGLYLAAVGLLMVSRLPTFSPKSLRVPRERSGLVLIVMALIIGVLLTRFWLSLIVLTLLYGLSLLHSFYKVITARRRAAED